ncbi:hypothetical protein PAMP_016257 [Pampus punctatissimus]
MSVCWMFMILLGCRLSHASPSKSMFYCNYQLEIMCVPAGYNVSIPCPALKGEVINFMLYKDNKEVNLNASTGVREFQHNGSTSFILTGVNASSHGVYRCESRKIYPPPSFKEALVILLLIEGRQCNNSDTKRVENQVVGLHWIWISVIVVLCIYSIIITIIALVNHIKLRHSDCQSDYINTKPRAPKDRKKRGFLNPIPRHF